MRLLGGRHGARLGGRRRRRPLYLGNRLLQGNHYAPLVHITAYGPNGMQPFGINAAGEIEGIDLSKRVVGSGSEALSYYSHGFQVLIEADAVSTSYIAGEGIVSADGTRHGFRLHNDGTIDDIGTLPNQGTIAWSTANALNSRGDVVGNSRDLNAGYHAVIYTNDGQLTDLNSYVDPQSGWVLESATGINDVNDTTKTVQVVGFGTRDGATIGENGYPGRARQHEGFGGAGGAPGACAFDSRRRSGATQWSTIGQPLFAEEAAPDGKSASSGCDFSAKRN